MHSEFDIYQAPGHLIRRAQQVHAAVFAETVSEQALTTPQFAVLAALRKSPQIDQVRLCQRMAIDRSTIADVASRLEERGLIRRERDKLDARRNLLSLTRKGKALHDRTLPEVVEVGEKLLEPLTPAQRKQIIALLTAIISPHDPFFAASGGHYPDG